MKFDELLQRVRKRDKYWKAPNHMVALDPGETTGAAHFLQGSLYHTAELRVGKTLNFAAVEYYIKATHADVVVCEDYRVYSWKAAEHSWEALNTPQLIGVIRYLCTQMEIPLFMQMAATAKGFCKDKKLKQWGYYEKGARHARDAVRHGCYWLLFNKEWKGGKLLKRRAEMVKELENE